MTSLVDQVAGCTAKDGDRSGILRAIAAGETARADRNRKDIPFRQILAAVGQGRLMHTYEELFEKHDIVVAQALLTKRELSHRRDT